jgi:hypothetical protein
MTTNELLRVLEDNLPVPLRHRLQELLMDADIVKISLQRPDRREARKYLEVTARWIQAAARDLARQSHEQKDVA